MARGTSLERLVAELTLEEKVSLLAGADLWTAPGVPRLGIPPLKLSDGPSGVRGGTVPGVGLPAACFPCGAALAATWSPELVADVGRALGDEALAKGAHVLLAPTVNLHRSPLAGRNFECYSEDPLLSARLAVAFVDGVQSRGVGASVKHFVCNDSEHERHTQSSDVDERALREIYLPPFEAAVREAGAWTLMGAYNRVNGTHACEHPELLRGVLKEEWGFDGVVVSDWYATQSAAPAVVAGLDLEMPGPPRRFGDALVRAVREGELAETRLDDAVRRVLRLRDRVRAVERPADAPERAEDRPEHRELARRAAREAVVLLRNQGEVLPLSRGAVRRLAVLGPNADVAVVQGGGSAQVTPHYAVSPLEGIREAAGPDASVVFERGCTNHRDVPVLGERLLEGPLRVAFFADAGAASTGNALHEASAPRAELAWFESPTPGVPRESFAARVAGRLRAPESGEYTFQLAAVGPARLLVHGREVASVDADAERSSTFFGTGSVPVTGRVTLGEGEVADVEVHTAKTNAKLPLSGVRVGCLLPERADAMERAVAAAAGADAAVVVVGLTAEWETEGRDRVSMELPGRQAELVRRVASANPRTAVVLNAGSCLAMDWLAEVPAVLQLWYPGQECGRALAEILFGDADPGGRLPTTFPRRLEDSPAHPNYPGENGHVLYGEGIFVGYRGYEAKRVEPLFPFGHGLSYTRFEIANLAPAAAEIGVGDALEVRVDVRNAGRRAGSTVVQLYVHDVQSRLARPPQELAAFEKVHLGPGETRTLTFTLPPRALSYWDPSVPGWVAEPGEFEVRAGESSRDLRATAPFVLKG